MHIIFLDIDGVLCTLRAHFVYGDQSKLMEAFDPVAVDMIKQLCKVYDCKLVISSSWRKDEEDCMHHMKKHSLHSLLHEDWRTISINTLTSIRGHEIDEWLTRHPEISSYLIFDDDTDFTDQQKLKLIHTNAQDGISADNYMLAQKLLNKC